LYFTSYKLDHSYTRLPVAWKASFLVSKPQSFDLLGGQISLREIWFERRHPLLKLVNVTEQNIPMIHAALASTNDYVKTRPDNARRFLQAYLEGIKITFTEPDFAKQVIGKYSQASETDHRILPDQSKLWSGSHGEIPRPLPRYLETERH
jgi:hypothetical protein